MRNDANPPSWEEVNTFLSRYTNYERTNDYKSGPSGLGTERIERLLERIGRPHRRYPVIHVAGTKGKGSIASLTAQILGECGYRTGLFLSPHVYHLRERIQIEGHAIGEEAFCRVFHSVRPALEAMADHPTLKPPTYFETLTALAMRAFADEGVDAAVFEVGMGGRLDATNVPDLPVVASGIGTISRDHTKQLGTDLRAIAGEKAGILRERVPVVSAPQTDAVREVLRERANAKSAPLRHMGTDIRVTRREAPPLDAPEAPQRLDLVTWRARHFDVPLPLLGEHQQPNVGVALGLAENFLAWRGRGPVDTAALRRAFREEIGRAHV
jgi:dihydrofolate synthase / folylpolyglutamate synthase